MLETFYPDGIALSPTERTEVIDQYNDWKESVKDKVTARVEGGTGTVLEVRMINFSMFEEWLSLTFTSILKHPSRDRLLDCTLRSALNTKKRQAHAESSFLEPESQSMRKISFMIPQPFVKTRDEKLNGTPQHIDTPFDTESEYIKILLQD